MVSMTEKEYRSLPVPAPVSDFFQEREWYRDGDSHLGVVTLDGDGEWNWVVLAKDKGGEFRGVAFGNGYPDRDGGPLTSDLREALRRRPPPEDGPPLTLEAAAEIVSGRTGMPVEQVVEEIGRFGPVRLKWILPVPAEDGDAVPGQMSFPFPREPMIIVLDEDDPGPDPDDWDSDPGDDGPDPGMICARCRGAAERLYEQLHGTVWGCPGCGDRWSVGLEI